MNILKKLNFFKWSWKKPKNKDMNQPTDDTAFYANQPSDFIERPAPRLNDLDPKVVEEMRRIELEEQQKNQTYTAFEERETSLDLSYQNAASALRGAVERFNEQKQYGHTDKLSQSYIDTCQKTIADLKLQRQQLELEKKTFLMNNPLPQQPIMNPPSYPYQQPTPFPPQQPQYTPQPPVMSQPYQVPQPQFQAPPMQSQSDFLLQMMYQEVINLKTVILDIQRNTAPVKHHKPRKNVEKNPTE